TESSSSSSTRNVSLLGFAATMMAASTVATSNCEEALSDQTNASTLDQRPSLQVDMEDIEELVDEIMNDPSVNLSLVPDILERRIYKSTIQLTINAFYMGIGSADGVNLFSHQIKVERASKGKEHKEKVKDYLADQTRHVNVEVLEEVADRMLANPAINSRMLPDAIEKQIYVNCMVVIFRVLAVIVNSFRITICGHDFGLSLKPHQFEDSAMKAMAYSSLSKIDVDKLKAFAEACGIPHDESEDMTEGFSVWDKFWNRREFMVNLHTCLYSLVLGILDDVLANTKIRVLSDEITLDVIASVGTAIAMHRKTTKKKDTTSETVTQAPVVRTGESSSKILPAMTFAAGIGLGATLSAALNGKR
ncbi:MAG: hypothetical protein SGILL_004525, partial [Bacillariaceae sp.]